MGQLSSWTRSLEDSGVWLIGPQELSIKGNDLNEGRGQSGLAKWSVHSIRLESDFKMQDPGCLQVFHLWLLVFTQTSLIMLPFSRHRWLGLSYNWTGFLCPVKWDYGPARKSGPMLLYLAEEGRGENFMFSFLLFFTFFFQFQMHSLAPVGVALFFVLLSSSNVIWKVDDFQCWSQLKAIRSLCEQLGIRFQIPVSVFQVCIPCQCTERKSLQGLRVPQGNG